MPTAAVLLASVLNLVPAEPGRTPSYWCTWGAQNYAVTGVDELDHSMIAGNLTEAALFGPDSWARAYAKVHGDLFLLYDLGWDVPKGTRFNPEGWRLGSLIVADDKFPCCSGTPAERLRKLDEVTRRAGWRGAGIWIPAQAHGDGRDGQRLEGGAPEQN